MCLIDSKKILPSLQYCKVAAYYSVVVSGIGLINEVNRHWARLVLGWVTVCGRVNHLGM